MRPPSHGIQRTQCSPLFPSIPPPLPPSLLLPLQFYCDAKPCGTGPNGVAIFNVSYTNITGTSSITGPRSGISLQCSDTVPCQQIRMANVLISPFNKSDPNPFATLSSSFASASSSSSAVALRPVVQNAYGSDNGVVLPWPDGGWTKGALPLEDAFQFTKEVAQCG